MKSMLLKTERLARQVIALQTKLLKDIYSKKALSLTGQGFFVGRQNGLYDS